MRIDKNATLTYKKVFEITQNRKFKRIIDIGCGNTNLLKKIKQKKHTEHTTHRRHHSIFGK